MVLEASFTAKVSEVKDRGTSLWYEQIPHYLAPAECCIYCQLNHKPTFCPSMREGPNLTFLTIMFHDVHAKSTFSTNLFSGISPLMQLSHLHRDFYELEAPFREDIWLSTSALQGYDQPLLRSCGCFPGRILETFDSRP